MSTFRPFLSVLALAASVSSVADTPTKDTPLFDGKTLTGWSLVSPSGAKIGDICHVSAAGTIEVADTSKTLGYLLADGSYTNFKLHIEWRWPADAKKSSNSGFLMNISSGPVDRATWPVCLQVQTKLNHAGDFLPMAGFSFAEKLSTPPDAKTPQLDGQKLPAEKPLGEWNSADITCKGDSIEATINGVFENKVTGCKPASGQIGVQLEGTPYELRNIVISPLP